MSWLSKKLHKSAKRNTGIFSWANHIPGIGKYVDQANELLDKDADKKGLYQDVGSPEEKKSDMMPVAVALAVAYFTGMF